VLDGCVRGSGDGLEYSAVERRAGDAEALGDFRDRDVGGLEQGSNGF
jgi:hypothetical protein